MTLGILTRVYTYIFILIQTLYCCLFISCFSELCIHLHDLNFTYFQYRKWYASTSSLQTYAYTWDRTPTSADKQKYPCIVIIPCRQDVLDLSNTIDPFTHVLFHIVAGSFNTKGPHATHIVFQGTLSKSKLIHDISNLPPMVVELENNHY